MEKLSRVSRIIVMTGDFNVDWLNKDGHERKQLYSIFETYGFVQNIDVATSKHLYLLDYIITGISNGSTLTAATPRHTQKKDGLIISRVFRNTRSSDVVNYIRNEANLNLRCNPVLTKYDS